MKTIKYSILLCAALLFMGGCDKDFEAINTNPYAVVNGDPALLFSGSQRSHLGNWTAEHTIVQHFVCPYNTGANNGFNFNVDVDDASNPKWNQSYPGAIRNITHAMELLGPNTDRVNLLSMLRIWKAQIFMGLVDSYGHVPYFNAGQGLKRLPEYFYPTYDEDAVIYEDLYNELKEAMAALDPNADYVAEDLFYGANAHSSTRTSTPADQVAKWIKLGNSLLLRLGMRYSKVNASKAESIVSEAVAAGVMTSNADNAFVKYDGVVNVFADNNNLRNFSQFNYAAEPFVDHLKATNDPRAKFIVALFTDPGKVANESNPDTELANQFGAPIGIVSSTLATDGSYRGPRGDGLNYSQMNVWRVASPDAPAFYVTYAQTLLLMAEAAHRGWIGGSAQTYYEEGIRADMDIYALYPSSEAVPDEEYDDYIAEPGVVWDEDDALELINNQYWVVNIRNGTEAFANFRRSGYPTLSPSPASPTLPDGGFVRRLSYPNAENSANKEQYQAAVAKLGADNLTSRVFWDAE